MVLLLIKTHAGFTDLLMCPFDETLELGARVCPEVQAAVEDEL